MKKFLNQGLVLSTVFLAIANPAFAESNFLTGIAHTQISADLSHNTAGMAAVEVGPLNYRVSGTLGWSMNPCNRVKLTGEWLWQDINYTFKTGSTQEWVSQAAVGLGYQLALNNRFLSYLDFSGYYSHAPSKNLIEVDFLDAASGNIFTNLRRIAGSSAGGVSPGVHLALWQGAEGNVALNWDDVVYDNVNTAKVTARGFGGTAGLTQALFVRDQQFNVHASAAVRRPFDFYRAAVDWVHPLPTSQLLIGLFGEYTHGKNSLPNTSLVGLNLSYAIDTPTIRPANTPAVQSNSLLAWVSDPAVYMPQVLAIADGTVNQCTAGSGPGFRGTIGNIQLADLPLDLLHRFTGNGPLRFSLTKSSGDATIDPTTGKVTATVPSTNIVVTATGPCGGPAVSNSFNITA